jgi:hypothetical protein
MTIENSSYVYLHCDLLDRAKFDNNHFENEIISHRNALTTFAKRHICEGGKSLVLNQNQWGF